MLYSESQERARRFRLALRMGIPILLLIFSIIIYAIRKDGFIPSELEIVLVLIVLFISTYFLFFLINLGQDETYIDRMTGAFNRKSLFKNLEKRLKLLKPYTIVLFRIENLPSINEHYGIDRADRTLKLFTHMIDDFLKLYDIKEPIIGRYHGGDFILGLPISLNKSIDILKEFEATYKDIGYISLEYKFIGIENDENIDIKDIVNHLYDSIAYYKSLSVKTYNKKINPKKLEYEVVDAIESERLILHYIPTLNTKTNDIDLFEVGVKLETKSGILPPKKFISIVNRLGLEKNFDETLFRVICKDIVLVDSKLKFSFNISPFSLRNPIFVDSIKKIASTYSLDYSRFIIELFENRPLKDINRYRLILDELRSLGIEFSLDNFGALNASFEYIKKLPVDMVQFDKEFTISYNDKRILAILKAYIQACKSMEVKSLIKWVDNEEKKHLFTSLGIDYLQGFAISNRPLDSELLLKNYGGEK